MLTYFISKGGCHSKKRSRFNKNVQKHFKVEYTLENKLKLQAKDIKMSSVLRWKFNQLDSRKDSRLRRSEFRDLQRLIRRHVKPRKCAKKFPLMCDKNLDKNISLREWTNCFTTGKIERPKPRKKSFKNFRAENEVQVGMGPVNHGEPCRRERKQAVETASGTSNEFYIPECDEQGYYQPIQCYGSADKKQWYCFCVDIQLGRMIESTSIRNGTPNCPLASRRKPWPDCPAPDLETKFLKSLTSYLIKFAVTINRKIRFSQRSSEVETALKKIFIQLDRNKNESIDKKERRNLKKLIKKDRKLWTCGKNIHKVCDINDDKKISLEELTICITPRKNASKSNSSKESLERIRGKNPFIEVIKSQDI